MELFVAAAVAAILAIGAVSFFAGRIGVAAPLLLVVVGIAVSLIPQFPPLTIEADVVLVLILPPLLYASALHLPLVDFRRNLRVIIMLAVVLVVVSALLVGVVLHAVVPAVSLSLAIAVGAVVAPPDAVAAISLGKRLGLPPRIVTILEGEGLVNDATALVLLATALAVATGTTRFSGPAAVGAFVGAVAGALVVGLVVGWLTVLLRSKMHDPVLDTAIALVVPFGAYLLAEELHSSGVVAVVVAGMVVGNLGKFRIAASFRATETATWSTSTRIVENGVFLLMGLALPPVVWTVHTGEMSLPRTVLVGLLVTGVLVAARFAFMPLLLLTIRGRYGAMKRKLERHGQWLDTLDQKGLVVDDQTFNSRLEGFRRRLQRGKNDLTAERDQRLGWRDGVVLGWAGMRGVVTVAAAQTLPKDSPEAATLVLIAFSVAIITLMAQGFTLGPLVTALKLSRDSTGDVREMFAALHRELKEAGDQAVQDAASEMGNVSDQVLGGLAARSESVVQRAEDFSHADFDDEDGEAAQILRLRRIELTAQRRALYRASSVAAYPSEVIGRMIQVLDGEDMQMRSGPE